MNIFPAKISTVTTGGLIYRRLDGAPRAYRRVVSRWIPMLVLFTAINLAVGYAAVDRSAAELVLGGVVGIAVLAVCSIRPRPALLAFVGIWGVVHVVLSHGELEGAAGGSGSISQGVGAIVIVGFAIAVAGHRSQKDRALPFALKAFATFAVMYTFAEVITPARAIGLSDLVKLVGGLVLAFVAYYVIDSERWLLALSRAVGIAGGVVALVALAQYALGVSLGLASAGAVGETYRATSVAGSPNGAADFLLVCTGFALLGYTLRRDRCRARADLATVAILALGIGVTFTRSDIIGLAIMFIVWASLWQLRAVSAMAVRRRLAIVAVAISVGTIQVVGVATLAARVEGRLHPSSQANVLNGREAIWANEFQKLRSGSLATSLIGSGTHTSYTSVYLPQSGRYYEYPPHNILLWLLVETGVIGLAIYLAFLVGLGRSFLRTARRWRFTVRGQVAAVALATTLAFVVDSMFHNTQVTTDTYWYFMVFVGATLRMIELRPSVPAGKAVR